MWKLIQADDGDLTSQDLLFLSVFLATAVRRAERMRRPEVAAREREVWEKIQPAVHLAVGWDADAPE